MSKQVYPYSARPSPFEQRILKIEDQIVALRSKAAELELAIARLSRLIDETVYDRAASSVHPADPSLSCVSPR